MRYSVPTLCDPMDCSPRNSPAQNTGVGSLSLLQGIFPTQGSNPGLPAWQTESLPAEPPGKPKNLGVGNLSLLQQILPTQESNQSLLHCRRILYQLSHQGSPVSIHNSSVPPLMETVGSSRLWGWYGLCCYAHSFSFLLKDSLHISVWETGAGT